MIITHVKKTKEIDKMNYLVVVAHPDDEVLGAGATIHKLIKEGHNVAVAIMVSQAAARKGLSDSLLEDEFGDKAMEVRQKITEIDALVQKKENPSKVKMLLMDLKNLSIGVTGSLIATGIVDGIKLLFI